MQHQLFLSLGSNLGDKQKNIERAYQEIEKRIGKIVSRSAFYATRPDGFESENDFANAACEVLTSLDCHTVLRETQRVEKELGRAKKSVNGAYSDRIIDIDILLFDHLIIEQPHLTIPHPRFHLRRFVLDPLAEISPDTIHPILQKTILEIRDGLNKFSKH